MGLAVGVAICAAGAMEGYVANAACTKVVIAGEVSARQEWKVAIGEGWVFRVVPIVAGQSAYSGWDLIVDRAEGAGFPDALLLATLPYNSINEREVGTTFGLRAQDAIGWNPRSFRFLTSPAALREAQQLYTMAVSSGWNLSAPKSRAYAHSVARLLELQNHAAAGEFRILDARLVPGIGDAQKFAENWALAAARMQHEVVAPVTGQATPAGSIEWMRFSVTLWLPSGWKTPAQLHPQTEKCSQ